MMLIFVPRFSDILVGAPYFTYKKDEGRVYIYLNNKQVGENFFLLLKNVSFANSIICQLSDPMLFDFPYTCVFMAVKPVCVPILSMNCPVIG